MKTTREIINDELGVILNSVDYDVNHALFEINKNKEWFSEEEIREAISATWYVLFDNQKVYTESDLLREFFKHLKKNYLVMKNET